MDKNNMIVKFDKSLPIQENVKNLVITECNLSKALKEIRKISNWYSDEIKEQKEKIHITKGGEVKFIDDMDDSHLINTVKLLLKNNGGHISRGMKKYVNEIKKRGLVNEVLSNQEPENVDEVIIDEDSCEIEYKF